MQAIMTKTDTGQRSETAAVIVLLFGMVLIAVSMALLTLTFFVALGAGMTCEGDSDCVPFNGWIIAVIVNLFGQFAALPIALAIMKRIPREWAVVCIYVVISLTPIVLI